MPPKVKFPKEEIVAAALRVARRKGLDGVTTRDIAAELDISTRPIFTFFRSMDEVRDAVRDAARAVYDGYAAEGLASALARMAEDPAYETWVAQVDGAVAGMVTTVRALAVGMPQGYLKINGLAVAGPFRRQGVASALMDHVETLARQAGLGCVLLSSGVRREDAHAFYQSRGYCRDSWCFDKTL